MRLSRALRKSIGRVLIGVLFFAQFAVAAYACLSVSSMASISADDSGSVAAGPAAPVKTTATKAADMPAGCDQLDVDAANLCTEHCHYGQQRADTVPAPTVPAAMPTLLYTLRLEPAHMPRSGRSFPAPGVNLAAAPPPAHAILHCVFRV